MPVHLLFSGQSLLNDLIRVRDIARAFREQPDLQLDFTGIESVTPEFAAELCRVVVQTHGPDGLRSALLLQTMAFPVLELFVPAMQAAATAPVIEQHDSPADDASRSASGDVSRCTFLLQPFRRPGSSPAAIPALRPHLPDLP